MSEMRIRISVPGPPVGKGSVRVNTATGRAYTDAKSRAWMQFVALMARRHRPAALISRAVGLSIVAYFEAAKAPKWKREEQLSGAVLPTKKPDASNIIKGVEDALTGIIWVDDALVVDVRCRKFYAEVPMVEIEVWSI